MIGLVVTSSVSLRSCSLEVRSTASMSGLPFDVESVKDDDHIPSNCLASPFTSTLVFSTMSPVSPQCDSRMRTIGFASISLRSLFILISGVVPNPSISSASLEELMPWV